MTGTVSFLTPVWNYVDALVHPTARQDALTAARHRAFIAPRLLGSFVALASFPIYIVLRGVPGALEVGVFAWLVAPILIVTYLSRTGRYETAHILSSLSLTVLAGTLALFTGGIGSFAAIWLVVVPLEAALSASRRVIVLASLFTLTAASLLLALGFAGLLPASLAPAQTHHPRRARHYPGGALRHRPCARRRAAHAHQFLDAARRRRPLPAARPQHDGRHRAPRPQRRRAVCFAGGRSAARRAAQRAVAQWPVRPRPCRRSPRLSRRAVRCRHAQRRARARIPHPPRARCTACRPLHLGRDALPAAALRRR